MLSLSFNILVIMCLTVILTVLFIYYVYSVQIKLEFGVE